MSALRLVVSLLALAAGVALAVSASRGFTQAQSGPSDELPLSVGMLSGPAQGHLFLMGYPWEDRRADLVELRRDIPPDPVRPSADEKKQALSELIRAAKVSMPARRLEWPELYTRLRSEFALHGVKLSTGDPAVPAALAVELPEGLWTADSILMQVRYASQKMVSSIVLADGVFIGTPAACTRVSHEEDLAVIRRSLAAANAATPLETPFRPDYRDAPVANVARGMKAQTGVDVVIDVRIWDTGATVSWRGEPRPLREALDLLCERLGAFWRVKDGRIYVLVP